jgi:hypothetical protein
MTDDRNISEAARETIDRKLGDEWSDWVGDLSKYEKQIREGKSLFLKCYFAGLLAITAAAMALYYMISPRLTQFSPVLDAAVMWTVAVISGFIFIYSILLLLTITTGVNFIFASKKNGLHVEWIYPAVYAIGGLFKVSRDRIGHSLLKVNNALIYTTKKQFAASNLLVLLPRCLDKESRTRLTELTQKYGCHVFTATGGSSARQMLKKIRPDAIIGVACERDLVSGMADSPHYVPIIAVTNQRPNGPCKDTLVDIEEFERAVKFLSKK